MNSSKPSFTVLNRKGLALCLVLLLILTTIVTGCISNSGRKFVYTGVTSESYYLGSNYTLLYASRVNKNLTEHLILKGLRITSNKTQAGHIFIVYGNESGKGEISSQLFIGGTSIILYSTYKFNDSVVIMESDLNTSKNKKRFNDDIQYLRNYNEMIGQVIISVANLTEAQSTYTTVIKPMSFD